MQTFLEQGGLSILALQFEYFMKKFTYLFAFTLFGIVSCQSSNADASSAAADKGNVEEASTTPAYDFKKELSPDVEGPMTITGTFSNKAYHRGKYVKLYETEGKDIFLIDSAKVENGAYVINAANIKVGLHRIGIIPDERSLGKVILNPNEKNISINYTNSSFVKGTSSPDSKENQGWIEYMKHQDAHKAKVKEIRNSGNERSVKLKDLYAREAELKIKEDNYASEYAGTYFAKRA